MPKFIERRSERRKTVDERYTLEFSCSGVPFIYKFRIWNMSSKGMCILVRDDSEVLKHLTEGDVLEMKYYTSPSRWECLKTQIRHITKSEGERFKEHTMVGLQILEKVKENQ
jgi:hypothetical protein